MSSPLPAPGQLQRAAPEDRSFAKSTAPSQNGPLLRKIDHSELDKRLLLPKPPGSEVRWRSTGCGQDGPPRSWCGRVMAWNEAPRPC